MQFVETLVLKPLSKLAQLTLDEYEANVANRYFIKHKTVYTDKKMIAQSSAIEGMPTIQNAIHLARTIAVSTAVCESSVSYLKRILTPHRLIAYRCYTPEKLI